MVECMLDLKIKNCMDKDGKLEWSFETDGWVRDPVLNTTGTIYVGTREGGRKFYAISTNGEKLCEFEGRGR